MCWGLESATFSPSRYFRHTNEAGWFYTRGKISNMSFRRNRACATVGADTRQAIPIRRPDRRKAEANGAHPEQEGEHHDPRFVSDLLYVAVIRSIVLDVYHFFCGLSSILLLRPGLHASLYYCIGARSSVMMPRAYPSGKSPPVLRCRTWTEAI